MVGLNFDPENAGPKNEGPFTKKMRNPRGIASLTLTSREQLSK